LLPPPEELEERRLLDDVEREADVPDLDRLPLARLDDPLLAARRLAAFAVEPVRFFAPDERLRPEPPERLPLVLPERLPLELPEPLRLELPERPALRPPPCWARPPSPPLSSWSSLSPISFLATPTAAGTATPSAAPATTFLPVDIPSLSFSFPPFSFSAIATFLS